MSLKNGIFSMRIYHLQSNMKKYSFVEIFLKNKERKRMSKFILFLTPLLWVDFEICLSFLYQAHRSYLECSVAIFISNLYLTLKICIQNFFCLNLNRQFQLNNSDISNLSIFITGYQLYLLRNNNENSFCSQPTFVLYIWIN